LDELPPHLRLKAWNDKNNAIYLAKKTLSWDKSKPGVAVFRYQDHLVLTDATLQTTPGEIELFGALFYFRRDYP